MKNDVSLFRIGFLLVGVFFCNTFFAQENNELYASAEEVNVVILEPTYSSSKTNKSFEKRYHYLVARAYFRLLSDAQKSERKLKAQYERYRFENEKYGRGESAVFQRKLLLAHTKYNAHRAMLRGLKSWNLFSEDRTGDMFYFMMENEDRIFQMYGNDMSEDKMVKYLIYKLADLYHVEGEE
jgi:hypothetical protein